MLGIVSYTDKKTKHLIMRDVVGEFTLVVVIGDYDIPKGAILKGGLHKLGCSKFKSEDNKEIFPVLVLASHCSEKEVLAKLRKSKRSYAIR